ncbi:MAG: shikimate dehydrogenase [Bacteroidaceae bacterium]
MKKYGLIGYPLGHSFSKQFFTEKFEREGIDAQYLNFEMPTINHLFLILEHHPELCGLNITIPYKQQVISLLDDLSDEAREIGAVNVVRITRDEKKVYLKGFNSDAVGFTRSIQPLLKASHRKALVLGTGGASKAVIYGLHQLGIETMYVSRTEKPNRFTYEAITPEIITEFPVIVNCSPCGMYPHVEEYPALPYEAMTKNNLLYDLVYNPDTTLFMKKGAQHGATTKNGLEMLHLQAKASWEFWNK